jgi:hypothetical protein
LTSGCSEIIYKKVQQGTKNIRSSLVHSFGICSAKVKQAYFFSILYLISETVIFPFRIQQNLPNR